MAGPLRREWGALILGVSGPFPAGTPRGTWCGFALWRACILLVPVGGFATRWALDHGGKDGLIPFFALGVLLTAFTFGLALLVLVPLWGIAMAVAEGAPFFTLPMGVFLAWELGRVLQGRHEGPRPARGLLGLAAAGGVLSAFPLVAALGVPGLLALLPLVVVVLLGRRSSRAFLRSRAGHRPCPVCRHRPEVLSAVGGVPCPTCGTRVL